MKALVLAGGFPQIDLIEKLKARGIYTLLADYYEHPVARDYADAFFRISTLDVEAIKRLAVQENVDFLITVCTDQALLTVAQVSQELGLPCYVDYQTARNVTNKSYMKHVMSEHHIPTAPFRIAGKDDQIDAIQWQYPLIVKPVDCNSSKGVIRVTNHEELKIAFDNAVALSRTNTAVIEGFIEGKELSVDVFVEDGEAKVLDITTSEKLKDNVGFIIYRTWHPAKISDAIKEKVHQVAQRIADAFGLINSPMLIQMLVKDDDVYVIEFSARTGGGVKHLSIKYRAGVDIVSAVIDLTLGNKPAVKITTPQTHYMIDEYIYCKSGEFDHLEGFEQLKEEGILLDYYLFRSQGTKFDTIANSGDRLGGFTIEADTLEELTYKHELCNSRIRAKSKSGEDLIRHDLLQRIDINES